MIVKDATHNARMPEISPQRTARLPRFGDALGHGASDKRIDILRGIALSGSISQAARESGVSYKAAWQAIDTLTNLAGVPLVARLVGGAGGGGALLTADGRHLLELAEALDAARRDVHARWVANGADAAERADAVTAGLAVRTSMRNQLPAVVETLVAVGRTVRVRMRLGPAVAVAASVTEESVQLLGLAPGLAVIALCKATAVRVERAEPEAPRSPADNRILGSAVRVLRHESGDEVVLAVDGGLQLVGFAPAGVGLRVRHRVSAAVDESSVVVALPS